MAYDEALAGRIRRAVGPRPGVTEKKMFGGLAFLLDGKMFCGIARGDLMVRIGPDRYAAALAQAHVRPMDFTGHAMNGYVFVSASGAKTARAVRKWVDRGAAFVATLDRLPPPSGGLSRPRPRSRPSVRTPSTPARRRRSS
jgi:TfoX/Sxy family transcriptional regulator of competence genes